MNAQPPIARPFVVRGLAGARAGERDADGGFALALAVLVGMVLLMMVGAMLLPVVQDTTTAIRAASLTENRLVAESVLNELFTEIRLDVSPSPNPTLAGRIAPGKRVSDAGTDEGWARWDVNANRATRCDGLLSSCYSYAIATPTVAASGAERDYVVAEVTVRTRCKLASSCVLRRYQQRWHRRRFLDYALFTQYETLAPSLYTAADAATVNPLANCDAPAGIGRLSDPPPPGERSLACQEVIFASVDGGGNVVNGPIHTNDPQFWVCGRPTFTSVVEASSSVPLRTLGGSCRANPDVASATVREGPVLAFPQSVTQFAAITPDEFRFLGPTVLHLNGETLDVTPASGTAASLPLPRRGIVYVEGPVTIDGAADGLTVVAAGAVQIAGDLVGTDLGIVADGDIAIAYSADVRTVQASLLSRTGTIYNDGLRTPVPAGTTPRLLFTGAMISKFHPAAGLFDPTNGRLTSGMVSTVNYPASPPNPPYFLEPVQANWERIDFTEIALGSASDGSQSGIAGVPARGEVAATDACRNSGTGDGVYLATCLAPTAP